MIERITHCSLMVFLLSGPVAAAGPVITELQPRGAELSKPFTLTVIGRDLGEGVKISSTLPAVFTPLTPSNQGGMMMAGRAAAFLVEPRGEVAPGVFPVRLETPDGISNVLLFTVGTFPETQETESTPYSQPNQNDSIETAEPVRSAPVTVNGTLRGAERDVFRISAKAGEQRTFEVEARRCGSALDPVITILDGSGKQLARSEDTPGTGLDARLDFTFPKEGNYYVEVHDARFSKQVQNFYRLKMGSYPYAEGIFPLGGRRGETVEVKFFGPHAPAAAKTQADLRKVDSGFSFVGLPGSAALPFPFAVSDLPELVEPGEGAIAVPGVINGRLAKAGEIDRYRLQVQPGERLLLELQARELGTSRIEGIISVYDTSGKKLDSAGDKPLPEDVFQVQGTTRTSNDPFLNFTVPKDTREIVVTVEDLALRGGPSYGYRLIARKQAEDFQISLISPEVNVPAGGTVPVRVLVDRRGYNGPIQLTIPDLPKGIRVEGGLVPGEAMDASNNAPRNLFRRGVLVLSADPGVALPPRELVVWAEGKLGDGTLLKKRALGIGMLVEVAGATTQGVVDRQRPLTAPWLGMDLPVAAAPSPPATLEVRQTGVTRMAEGARYEFAFTWKVRNRSFSVPEKLTVDVVGARDVRITDMKRSPSTESDDPITGTFLVHTSKATDPGKYDMIVGTPPKPGAGPGEEIVARPLAFEVAERSQPADVAAVK